MSPRTIRVGFEELTKWALRTLGVIVLTIFTIICGLAADFIIDTRDSVEKLLLLQEKASGRSDLLELRQQHQAGSIDELKTRVSNIEAARRK